MTGARRKLEKYISIMTLLQSSKQRKKRKRNFNELDMINHNSSSPFHTIVVTSPDGQAARAAEDEGGPLHRQNLPSNIGYSDVPIQIISTSDPYNTRMGSGGGTLAALDEADADHNEWMRSEKNEGKEGSVLIIHAGGQSSRCPTQMTLGKAWTDLPISQKGQLDAQATDTLTNPTYILMESLSNLLRDLPHGSVVVAASDVMLHLPGGRNGDGDENSPLSFDEVGDDKVLGLAVPAPLHTAKNHGVFSLDGDVDGAKGTKTSIQAVDTFFQKPSIDTMKKFPGCTFPMKSNSGSESDSIDMAWIDTGVIIFLPKAANALRKLIQGDLSHYTANGLAALYRNHKLIDSSESTKNTFENDHLEKFAKATIQSKLELYSHLLLAISTKGAMQNADRQDLLQKYLTNESNGDFCPKLLENMFDHLSGFELQVCTVPRGNFIHLGTTIELLQFMIPGANQRDSGGDNGSGLHLTNRAHASLEGVEADNQCIVMNSVVDSTSSSNGLSSIGTQSILEHCFLQDTTLKVGSNCVVSGLRGRCSSIIDIPSNMVLQMLPVDVGDESASTSRSDGSHYVFMYLGIHDEIKKHGTCYGVEFEKLCDDTGIQSIDLWEQGDTKRFLWNAKMHPIMMAGDDGVLDWEPFLWIRHYLTKVKDGMMSSLVQSSLKKWRALKKLSLAEIQGRADACSEFSYRSNMKESQKLAQTVESFKSILVNRRHEEIKLCPIIHSISVARNKYVAYSLYFKPIFDMFEDVILSKLRENTYDICSRCLMILSAACLEYAEIIVPLRSTRLDANEKCVTSYLESLKSLSTDPYTGCKPMLDFLQIMIKRAIETCDATLLEDCAGRIEDAAFAFITKCVTSSIPKPEVDRNSLPPCGSWVISNAPARIDLSGGWSDTPPVSYEFGGAVCCLAVILRDVKPLSARCRRVKGSPGILLTVENRDIDSGNLLESESVHLTKVKDLSDFRDPLAKCALLKCAVVALGLIPLSLINERNDQKLDEFLCELYEEESGESCGLELVSTSLLPHGSGLGTSSILAGCVLSSLGQCLGLSKVKDPSYVIRTILNLEQLLSTGGGWQDQVGGLYPGLKLCTAETNVIPIQVNVETHEITTEHLEEMNKRLLLAFSGKPRLAKNILQKVLRQWARRSPIIVSTVQSLVDGAHQAIDAIKQNDHERLGRLINAYWSQKKVMAGEDSGVEPVEVQELFVKLTNKNVIDGATLTGAGGGGFMALLLREGRTAEEAKKIAANESITWYQCKICSEGLRSFVVSDVNKFHLHWHFVEQ